VHRATTDDGDEEEEDEEKEADRLGAGRFLS
jgi:hypothetical protein